MKTCWQLLAICFCLGMAGCQKEAGAENKDKPAMVIPAGGKPINPLQKDYP